MPLSSSGKARLNFLAKSGKPQASSMAEGYTQVSLTPAPESANAIVVTGQVLNGVGVPLSGVRLVVLETSNSNLVMTDAGAGTFHAGASSVKAWVLTDATGKFEVSVAQGAAGAGTYHMTCVTDKGAATVALVFA